MAAKKKAAAKTGPAAGSTLRRQLGAEDVERINVLLEKGLASRLRVHCAEHRRTLSDAVEQALREMLDRGADG